MEPKLVRVLTQHRPRRILLQFAPRPRSISQVAAATGEPIEKVFYYVRSFIELGLVFVVHEERRQGKPIKFYQTVAARFFLPAEVIEKPLTASLAEELLSSLEHNLHRGDLQGVAVFSDEDGGVQIKLLPRPKPVRKASAAELWQVVRLTDAAASALAEDLRALFKKYDGGAGEGDEFLLHAAFSRKLR